MYEASIIICIIAMVAVCIAVPSILVYLVVDSIRDHRSTKVNPAKGKAHLIFAHCKDCHSLLHMDGTCHWCPSKFWESHAYFRTSEPFVGIEPVYTCGYCGTSDDPNDICDLCFAKLMSHNAGPFKGDYTIMDEEDYLENYGYCDYDAEEEAYQAQFAATDYYGRMMATFSDGEDDLDVYDAKPDLTRKEIRISKRATSSLKHKNLTPKPKSKA